MKMKVNAYFRQQKKLSQFQAIKLLFNVNSMNFEGKFIERKKNGMIKFTYLERKIKMKIFVKTC